MFEDPTVRSTGSPSAMLAGAAAAGLSPRPKVTGVLGASDGFRDAVPPPGNATTCADDVAVAGDAAAAGAVIVTCPAAALLTVLPAPSIALRPTVYAAPAGSDWPAVPRSRLQVLPSSERAG